MRAIGLRGLPDRSIIFVLLPAIACLLLLTPPSAPHDHFSGAWQGFSVTLQHGVAHTPDAEAPPAPPDVRPELAPSRPVVAPGRQPATVLVLPVGGRAPPAADRI